jgi:hypothetical protein
MCDIIIDNIILDLYKLEDKLVYGIDDSNNSSENKIHPLDIADIIHSLAWKLNKCNTERKLDNGVMSNV